MLWGVGFLVGNKADGKRIRKPDDVFARRNAGKIAREVLKGLQGQFGALAGPRDDFFAEVLLHGVDGCTERRCIIIMACDAPELRRSLREGVG